MPGDYLCIVGENGSGKSTLMKTILGLLKPLKGEIKYGDGMAAGAIGYLPQQTVVQKDFPATVWEIVLSGCQARCGRRPFYSKTDKELARANIERMGIGHLVKRCYRELSGGQQQRVLLLCVLCVALLTGCASSNADSAGTPLSADVVYTDKDIQLDLAGMSGTVVYSMIYNIMYEPEQYLGKVIRIAGYYSAWENPELDVVYHSCVIPDATACCAQGIEFVWAGEHAYPDEYPDFGTDMIVTGRLESYMEGDYMYLHLVDAEVEWLVSEV